MHVHFVCTGNTFRSRLAESYLKSKKIKGLEVSSSGVAARDNMNGPITWYAARLIKKYNLIPYTKHSWTHTSTRQLKQADLVIFMDDSHHKHSVEKLHFVGEHAIWKIPDLGDVGFTDTINNEQEAISATEKIFSLIKNKVDALAHQFITKNR